MAYNEALAERIRGFLSRRERISERKMFGGIAFMGPGGMVCGVIRDDLMARVSREGYDEALTRDEVRPMDFTGRVSRGMVFVGPSGYEGARLDEWLERCWTLSSTLPPKTASRPKRRRKAAG